MGLLVLIAVLAGTVLWPVLVGLFLLYLLDLITRRC